MNPETKTKRANQRPHKRRHASKGSASTIGESCGIAEHHRQDSFSDVSRALNAYMEKNGMKAPAGTFCFGGGRRKEEG